jgi:mono/diheme cytochrome c family protein
MHMKPLLRLRSFLMLALWPILVIPAWAEEASEEIQSAFVEHMHGHLDQISEIKRAVIAGNLADTREPATWLATHEPPQGLSKAWLPYVDEMRRYAARAAKATDLVAAASAVSEIARTCGDCHRASGLSIGFGFDQRPPEELQSLMTQMQRHLWAADRMWEGLIGPSDVAWNRGANILSEVQLAATDIAGSSAEGASAAENQMQITELVSRARGMGEQGGLASSVELRSGLYGEFLSLCATCHELTGGGPVTR